MRSIDTFPKIYLYRDPVDMRRQLVGLSSLVQSAMAMDPFSQHLFVFCNRRRSLMKCVYWDLTGFAMWVKQLDVEKFPWPRKLSQGVILVSKPEFKWLLEGIDPWKIHRHKTLDYERTF